MNPTKKTFIHPTAIIDPDAQLGLNVQVGPYSIVENDVHIGDETQIDSHVLIAAGSRLGAGCKIFKGAVVGTAPQDLKFGGEDSKLVIGDRTIIREFCTLNRGTAHGGMLTKVGNDCFLMAYVHIAHDCEIGNHVILANSISMAGHIEIDDYVSIGGMSVIHQFVKIGCHAFIGGWSRIAQDVPPYILATGETVKYYGPNSIGLKRRGFSDEQIRIIKKAYRFIYGSKLNLKQAVSAIHSDMEITEEVKVILDFIECSDRGLSGR